MGDEVTLEAVKLPMSPEPLAARPIAVFEFVHVNVAPAGMLLKLVAATVPLAQSVILAGTLAVGNGFTVMVYVEEGPVHDAGAALVGVTVIVAVIGNKVALVAVKLPIFPEPLAARPMAVFEFIQVYVAPAGLLVNVVAATVAFAQRVMLAGTVTVGNGLTVTVTVPAGLTQIPVVAVTP